MNQLPRAWRFESNGSGRRGLLIWTRSGWRWKANMLGELVSARISHPVLSFVVNFGEEGYTIDPQWGIYMGGKSVDKEQILPDEVKNAPVVHFAIGCHNYANGTHSGHSLAATVVRRKHKIFFFNPWGRASMKNVVAGKLSTDVERPIQEINIMKYYDSIQFNGARNTKDNYLIDTVNEFSHGYFGIKIGTNKENERMGFSNIYPSPPSAFVYMGKNLQARNVEKTGGGLCSGYSAIFLMNPDIQNAIQNDTFPEGTYNGEDHEKLRKLIENRLRRDHCGIEQEYYLGKPTLSNEGILQKSAKTGKKRNRNSNQETTSRYLPVARKNTEKSAPKAAIMDSPKCTKDTVLGERNYVVKMCKTNQKQCVENLIPIRGGVAMMLKLSNVQTVTCERGTRYVRRHDVVIGSTNYVFFHAGNVVIKNGKPTYVPDHVGGLGDSIDVQSDQPTINNFDRLPNLGKYIRQIKPTINNFGRLPNWETHIRQIEPSRTKRSVKRPTGPKWRKLNPDIYAQPGQSRDSTRTVGGLVGSYNLFKKKQPKKAW